MLFLIDYVMTTVSVLEKLINFVYGALIFLIGFAAAFIGALAGGGGGLLSIPALIFLGLPANIAIATNKFGAMGFVGSTVGKFHKEKYIEWKYALPVFYKAGRVIGIDKNDCFGIRNDRFFQFAKINIPFIIVDQGIIIHLDII